MPSPWRTRSAYRRETGMSASLLGTYVRKAHRAHQATMALLTLLALVITARHWIAGVDPILRTVISLVPLAIVTPGLMARQTRSAMLLAILLLFYFFAYMPALIAPGNLLNKSLEPLLLLALFSSACLFTFWQQKAAKLYILAEGSSS